MIKLRVYTLEESYRFLTGGREEEVVINYTLGKLIIWMWDCDGLKNVICPQIL